MMNIFIKTVIPVIRAIDETCFLILLLIFNNNLYD